MNNTQLQSKSAQLLEQLSHLSREDERNAILMRELRNEAESLVKKSGQPTDYIALGTIDTRLNDPDRVQETFNQGMSKYPDNSQLLGFYAISLDKLGFVGKAMDYGQRAYETHQRDLFLLNHLIEHCINAGHLRTAQHWLTQWQHLQPNKPHKYGDFVERAVKLLQQSEVFDEAVEEFVQMSYAVLHDDGIYYTLKRDFRLRQDECSVKWITYEIELPRSVEETIDLGVELVDKFVQTDLDLRLDIDKVLVRYTSRKH